ncbi:hypothetical protein [Pseudomonas sp.]|uniref:hypothetical protein n=1 Tax=Pseudomonas sp. TaxID=306 RepID=UPI00258EA1E0|nr:hypothetical protein [Pseudomonas sp.]
MGKRIVAINEKGNRIGQNHPRARFTDDQVDRIRDLHEDHGMTYDQLSALFQCHKQTIASICQYRTRAQTPFGWKELKGE